MIISMQASQFSSVKIDTDDAKTAVILINAYIETNGGCQYDQIPVSDDAYWLLKDNIDRMFKREITWFQINGDYTITVDKW